MAIGEETDTGEVFDGVSLQGSDVETVDESVHLDRGENLFEIHISKVHKN